jgi:hypothetical protein
MVVFWVPPVPSGEFVVSTSRETTVASFKSFEVHYSQNHFTVDKLYIAESCQAVKFAILNGSRRFILVLTKAGHLSASWGRFIQFTSPYHISLKFILLLFFHLCLGHLAFNFPTETLHSYIFYPCVLHVVPISSSCFIFRVAFGEKYKSWRSTLCNFLQPRVTSRRSWLRHCATNRKVAGSIPDGVIGIFQWHNPVVRTLSTQPLTEMSTRNISLGGKGGRCVWLTTYHLHVPIV